MDCFTFIAALVKSLAWPAMVLILVLLLRKELRGLIPLLTKLKYKDIELEFGRKVEQLQARVAVELPEPKAPALPPGPLERMARLAEASPRAAVLEAWRELEVAATERVRRAVIAAGGDPSKMRPPEVLSELQKDKTLSRTAAEMLPVLRELRNRAAHAPEFAISSESALNYANVVSRITRELEG